MSNDCVFCKIVSGQIKPYKVYEDEYFVAVLDLEPLTKGHTLLIPKRHSNDLKCLDDDTLKNYGVSQKKVSEILKRNLKGVQGFTFYQKEGAFQTVTHVHLHIIPRYKDDFGFSVYDRGPKSKRGKLDIEWAREFVAKIK